MFSSELKRQIAEKVQQVLKETNHPELLGGEISFFLHVDGAEAWSWANIHNNGCRIMNVHPCYLKNRQLSGNQLT